ncbi:selenoprotein S-like [Diadema antillarum]|uniref:selenoprotein S-like n=1 Tax=Diadema antillarum TaxID=105358 RepID=UPI003A838FA9
MSGIFEHRELNEEEGNTTPESVSYGFAAASDFVASYGWYILFGVIGLVYLNSWLDTRLQGWRKQRKQEDEYSRYDADEVLRRQEAMERARERLQAQYDAQAEEYAKKQKEKAEQKSKEEIEDWERHQKGLGYKSKKKVTEDEGAAAQRVKQDKPKKRIRDDYNPLWGGQGSGFRPARRGFSGGG